MGQVHFSVIVFPWKWRLLADEWTSPRSARERLPFGSPSR